MWWTQEYTAQSIQAHPIDLKAATPKIKQPEVTIIFVLKFVPYSGPCDTLLFFFLCTYHLVKVVLSLSEVASELLFSPQNPPFFVKTFLYISIR